MILALLPLAFATPQFNVERGVKDAPFDLDLSPEDPGSAVLYSVDGTAPSAAWVGSIPISQTTIVRAQEIAADGTPSAVVTSTYLFPADIEASAVMNPAIVSDPEYGPVLDDTLHSLPSISIVVPGALSTVEQEVSFEWMDPDEGTTQANAGAALSGTTSLGYPKNSVRLYFRGKYGTGKLTFDLWGETATGVQPTDDHDSLSLRSGHDSVFYLGARGQYTRNLWMDESQLAMGHLAPHGRFAHLYLNGSYFGLYHVRERFNAAFMAEYLGGEEGDYESVNQGTVISGSGAGWAQVVAHEADYAGIQPWLNVPDFLDYMVLNFYAGNAWDWSDYHNWFAAGPSAPDSGGFRLESSDSDICLYYDYTVNIVSNPGPSDLFYWLMLEGDPDFRVAVMDAIHRNLEDDGPLTAENAGDRYARLAAEAEDAVVAESARWGYAWWTRDGDWIPERDRLLNDFFPLRTDEMLRQFRAVGWYPLGAPLLSQSGGLVDPSTEIDVTLPEGSDADLYVTTDGTDPRLSGGDPSPAAEGPVVTSTVAVEQSTVVKARLLDGDTWGPLAEAFYEVDAPAVLVLNEWNAVDPDHALRNDGFAGSGADDALGTVRGNGGDWIELLVTSDGDLRGWRLTMADRRGVCGELTFTEDPLLADVRAGTLLTIAEDLPEDASYNPDNGDWRFHLRAAAGASGQYITAADFDVTQLDWQLTVWDADGHVRLGPVGEGISPHGGISASEVGLLAADPSPAIRRDSAAYDAGTRSTFGAANAWDGGQQDLSGLRGESGGVVDADTAEDSGDPAAERPPGDCGCASGNPAAGVVGVLLAAVAGRRRDRGRQAPGSWAGRTPAYTPLLLWACTSTGLTPVGEGPAAQTCWTDGDLDGYGDPSLEAATCGPGTSTLDTDCDDSLASVNPVAPETCDGIDDDCDGLVDDADQDDGGSDVVDRLPFWSDFDGDGYGSDAVIYACAAGPGVATVGGDCDDTDAEVHPGATEVCDEVDQDCDGLAGDSLGASAECPAASCLEVLNAGNSTDGAYWIALPSGELTPLWCDLESDGGGWTLAFLRNTASTGSQGGFGGSDLSLADLGVSPAEASASAAARLGWTDLNAYEWSEMHLGAYASGSQTYVSRDIARGAIRIPFGSDGYYLYGGDSGYYWCGGHASYTDAGVGATDNPAGATPDCKGHGSLGSGWDFSEVDYANAGLTLCGGDGSYFLAASWGGTWTYYGAAGGAQAIWVR